MKHRGHIKTNLNFNDAYLRNNLPKIKNGAYVINCNEFKLIGTYWKSSYDETYFDSFGVEHIQRK